MTKVRFYCGEASEDFIFKDEDSTHLVLEANLNEWIETHNLTGSPEDTGFEYLNEWYEPEPMDDGEDALIESTFGW